MHSAKIRAFQMMLLSGLFGTVPLADAAAIISDGTDGPFNGGGAMATDGLQATSRTGGNPAPGAGAIGFLGSSGGSGGGGGSGGWFFGVGLGVGGGLLITTPGDIIVNGSILANGDHAGWGFANVFAHAGPGGRGSGGNIIVEGAGVSLGASVITFAVGGAGGGLSTDTVAFDPFFFSNCAHGGDGYVLIDAAIVDIDPDAIIDATLVPAPAALPLLVSALAVVGC